MGASRLDGIENAKKNKARPLESCLQHRKRWPNVNLLLRSWKQMTIGSVDLFSWSKTHQSEVRAKRQSENGSLFFWSLGRVATVALEDRCTVNVERYVNICLQTAFENVQEKHPRSIIILHRDNAPFHTATRTAELLTTSRAETMSRPA